MVCYLNAPDTKYNSCGEEIDGHKTERWVFDDTVRYVGDKGGYVAADTVKIAEQAVKLIQVEYEELPFYTDPGEALKEGGYPIHGESNIIFSGGYGGRRCGRALRQRIIYEDTYSTPAIHHSAIETHASIAVWDSSGKLTVYTPSQDVLDTGRTSAGFRTSMSRVRVVNPRHGHGGFGGKIDTITEPVTALLAMKKQGAR